MITEEEYGYLEERHKNALMDIYHSHRNKLILSYTHDDKADDFIHMLIDMCVDGDLIGESYCQERKQYTFFLRPKGVSACERILQERPPETIKTIRDRYRLSCSGVNIQNDLLDDIKSAIMTAQDLERDMAFNLSNGPNGGCGTVYPSKNKVDITVGNITIDCVYQSNRHFSDKGAKVKIREE